MFIKGLIVVPMQSIFVKDSLFKTMTSQFILTETSVATTEDECLQNNLFSRRNQICNKNSETYVMI